MAASRPASSASASSIQRPPSSLSPRPRSASGVSTSRPQSRISRRPSSRHGHRARLHPLAQALVTQMTSLREEGKLDDPHGEKFKAAVEFVLKTIEPMTLSKGAVSVDMRPADSWTCLQGAYQFK